jgi:hypothetical protein
MCTCVANIGCTYIYFAVVMAVHNSFNIIYSVKDFIYVCLLPKVICASNGQFCVNCFDIKATAYDIILFVDIFLVCVVTKRVVRLLYLLFSESACLVSAQLGFVLCVIFYLFFYVQEKEFWTS